MPESGASKSNRDRVQDLGEASGPADKVMTQQGSRDRVKDRVGGSVGPTDRVDLTRDRKPQGGTQND